MVSDQYSEGEFLRFGSGQLLADLVEFLRLHQANAAKLIFVGDPAQLPPVNSPFSPALDPEYLMAQYKLRTQEYELTDVVRQAGDSPILREATAIRETLKSPYRNRLSIQPSPPHIEALPEPELPVRFVEANRGTRLPRAICVAYSNATCLNLNVAIRGSQSGGDGMHPPAAGDVLLVIKNSALTGLLNGDLISVIWADDQPEVVRVPVGEDRVDISFRNVRILAETEDGSMVEIGTKIVENVLFSEKRDLSPLDQKALFVHFKNRHNQLKVNTKEFTEALRDDAYFNALQVKFGYAMTCHKAQGGEWDNVFLYFEHARTDAHALRWAYTALTRARKRIFGINLPNITPWAGITLPVRNRQQDTDSEEFQPPEQRPADLQEPLLAAPTRWDAMFPPEPGFCRDHHRGIVASLEQNGIVVENVEVRVGNYYWRYDLCKDDQRACLKINFRRNGTITPQVLPTAGTCPELNGTIIPLICVTPLTATASASITFPDDKPFLRAFHDDFMAPRVLASGATLVRLDHHAFLEKYHIAKGVSRVTLAVYYKAKGTVTSMQRESGDESLYDALFSDG